MNGGIIWAMLITVVALLIPTQINKSRSINEEIKQLNAQEVEALLKGDVIRLESLWSNDLVVTNPLNPVSYTHLTLPTIYSV